MICGMKITYLLFHPFSAAPVYRGVSFLHSFLIPSAALPLAVELDQQ
jgi:hypothetical protein